MHMHHVRNHQRSRLSLLLALIAALALTLAACADEDAAVDDPDEDTATAPEDADPIHIGWIAWDENIANTFLWKEILEEEGYEVEETQLDAAPVYAGLADGSIDVFLDAWLPITHEDYWSQYGDDIEDLGVWAEPGVLTIAVPDYVEVHSLEELDEFGDLFDNRIVGIEPGAGLTRITREEVMPGYGLDDWELLESSTPAMLTELDRAISSEEPAVVTLWRPHWAYAEYDIRDLEDPQGLLGDPEQMHALARDGFAEDYPQVAQWLETFELDDEQLGSLAFLVVQEAEDGQEQEAARQWIDENRDVVDGWLGR